MEDEKQEKTAKKRNRETAKAAAKAAAPAAGLKKPAEKREDAPAEKRGGAKLESAKKPGGWKKVYFYCEPGEGQRQETVHQVCAAARKAGVDAYIVYMDRSEPHAPAYEAYANPVQNEMDDGKDVLFVVPDVCALQPFKELNMSKGVLWTSPASHPGAVAGADLVAEESENGFRYNFATSEYARQFLRSWRAENVMFVRDHVGKAFLETPSTPGRRGKIVVYDASDGVGATYAAVLAAQYPDVVFRPVCEDFRDKDVAAAMDLAKVFLNLGPAGSRSRLPRKAAARGLVVVHSKSGCGLNPYDVPVDPAFKVDANLACLEAVADAVRHGLDGYERTAARFEDYRDLVLREEALAAEEAGRAFSGPKA